MLQKEKLNAETMASNYTAEKNPCLFVYNTQLKVHCSEGRGRDNQPSDKWELERGNKEVPLILIFFPLVLPGFICSVKFSIDPRNSAQARSVLTC